MFFGFLALGLNSVKGMSQFILVMFLPLTVIYQNANISPKPYYVKSQKYWRPFIALLCAFAFSLTIIIKVPNVSNQPSDALVSAVNAIEATIPQNIDKKSLKIYTPQFAEIGGYAEYRGFRCYIDSRAEVFLKANNHKEDILQEWVDYYNKRTTVQQFLDKYKFDYLIIYSDNDPLFNSSDNSYKLLFEDTTSPQIKVYQRL